STCRISEPGQRRRDTNRQIPFGVLERCSDRLTLPYGRVMSIETTGDVDVSIFLAYPKVLPARSIEAEHPVSDLVATFPDDHDKRQSVVWYPELNGIRPCWRLRRVGVSVRAAQHQHAYSPPLLRSIRHRDGSRTPDDV